MITFGSSDKIFKRWKTRISRTVKKDKKIMKKEEKIQTIIPNILISSEDKEPQMSKNTKLSQSHSPSRHSLSQHRLNKTSQTHQSQHSLNRLQGYDANSLFVMDLCDSLSLVSFEFDTASTCQSISTHSSTSDVLSTSFDAVSMCSFRSLPPDRRKSPSIPGYLDVISIPGYKKRPHTSLDVYSEAYSGRSLCERTARSDESLASMSSKLHNSGKSGNRLRAPKDIELMGHWMYRSKDEFGSTPNI